MIIRTGTLSEHIRAWCVFLLSFACIFLVTLFLGKFAGAAWDTRLLLFLNPDKYIPILDELVIFQTDFGAFYLAIIPLVWQIGYYWSRNNRQKQERAQTVFRFLAVIVGIWHGLGMFIQKRGIFWWGEYEYSLVFLPLGIVLFGGLWCAGALFVRFTDADQRKLSHAFWLSFMAVFFVNVIGEDNIKELIARSRPLHESNASWNGQIRIMQDEIVRGSFSYISGHSSSFWAQTFIYFLLIKSWQIRVPIILLGLFHGYTRLYTAAHFPYCVFMATLFGISVTSLVYYCLWNHKHAALVTMLFVCAVLFLMGSKPIIWLSVLGITVLWFLIYQYKHRHQGEFDSIGNALYL